MGERVLVIGKKRVPSSRRNQGRILIHSWGGVGDQCEHRMKSFRGATLGCLVLREGCMGWVKGMVFLTSKAVRK